MRLQMERQVAADGTGITCFSRGLSASDVR